jgi:phospholipid:diacylglycerol acyltransferase
MHMAAYDWRLSFNKLEQRDHFLTHLTRTIEHLVKVKGEKAVIVSHSMGGNLIVYYMQVCI